MKSVSMMAVLALAGCSSAQQAKPLLVSTVTVTKPSKSQPLPRPAPVTVGKPVQWQVIIRKNEKTGQDEAVYAVTPKEYERMSKMFADIIRYNKQVQYQLCFYRKDKDCEKYLK